MKLTNNLIELYNLILSSDMIYFTMDSFNENYWYEYKELISTCIISTCIIDNGYGQNFFVEVINKKHPFYIQHMRKNKFNKIKDESYGK